MFHIHLMSIHEGIFQPIKWEEGVIIDNTLSTTNSQSNNPSSRSGAETNPSSISNSIHKF